jgi:predicted metal-dependent hydrolase
LYPRDYIQYLAHFHGDRDYFECHEILEDYWKQTDPGNKDSIWVGFIQLAVSSYHHRRANFIGAKRTLEKALKIFTVQDSAITNLGLDKQKLLLLLNKQLSTIEKEAPYTSFDLPISDPLIVEDCIKTSMEKGFTWGNDSDMMNSNLIHRHKSRSKTSVITARNQALKNRKGNE